MRKSVRDYMAEIGRRGGLKKKLSSEEARRMQAKSVEARKRNKCLKKSSYTESNA